MAVFFFAREGKNNQGRLWCLVSSVLISRCLYHSQVVPSNWVTAPLKCHTKYFLSNPQILQSLAISRHIRKLPSPEDLVWVCSGQRQKGGVKKRRETQKEHAAGGGESQALLIQTVSSAGGPSGWWHYRQSDRQGPGEVTFWRRDVTRLEESPLATQCRKWNLLTIQWLLTGEGGGRWLNPADPAQGQLWNANIYKSRGCLTFFRALNTHAVSLNQDKWVLLLKFPDLKG